MTSAALSYKASPRTGIESFFLKAFTTLRTGSNFDDTSRVGVAGQNGLGVKLTNLFSESREESQMERGKRVKGTSTSQILWKRRSGGLVNAGE